jgi:hypothetical protein
MVGIVDGREDNDRLEKETSTWKRLAVSSGPEGRRRTTSR